MPKVAGRAVFAVSVFIGVAATLRFRQDSNMAAAARARHVAVNLGAGRKAVVMGATSGIGEGCALRLAEAGFSVIAVGRDPTRGAAVVAAMTARGGQGHEFIPCDAFVLPSIAACAASIRAKTDRVDVLVLSQGMATIQGFTPTPDGNDQKLTLHWWGRAAMITELLPLMRPTPAPRVISVLSGGVHSPYAGYKEDPELKLHYSIPNAANFAGFYNDLGLDALAVRPTPRRPCP